MKKTFRIRLRVKGCSIEFKEGLEEGVLAIQDTEFDLDEKEYESPLFTKTLLDISESLTNDVIFREVMDVTEDS